MCIPTKSAISFVVYFFCGIQLTSVVFRNNAAKAISLALCGVALIIPADTEKVNRPHKRYAETKQKKIP